MKLKINFNALALLLFIVFAGLCVWYYWVLNTSPFTQNAFVITSSRVVSPLVDGYITDIFVKNGQKVAKGTPLFRTFVPPYQLKVDELAASIAKVEAKLLKLQFQLKAAQSEERRDSAQAKNRLFLANQAQAMYVSDAVSQTYTEEAVRASQSATAQWEAAVNNVSVMEAEEKVLTAELKELIAQWTLAKIYLEQTTVFALEDGFISNMFIKPGSCQRAGDKLFALIPSDEWRIQANFEETALSLIQPGQKATIWLWQYPGKTFTGVVESVNYGVERRRTSGESAIQIVEKENQWFLLPQRLPVEIRVLDPDPSHPFNLGSSAYVRIHTSSQLWRQIVWRFYRW